MSTDLDARADLESYLAFLHDIFGYRTAMDVTPTYRDFAYFRRHGEWFSNPGLHGHRRGKRKRCYTNAFRAASNNRSLTYVQGLMTGPAGLVYAHAWCVDSAGHTIELTLDCETPQDRRYFGVRFSRSQLAALASEYGTYDWYEGFSAILARAANVVNGRGSEDAGAPAI